MRGTRYRIPRRVKKARTRLHAGTATLNDKRLLARCLCLVSMGGWKAVRRHNAHVAMGDTTTCRLRERGRLVNGW